MFRLSDIEELESKYDELQPILQVQDKDYDTDEIEAISDSEQEPISVISFYNNGDRWLVGEKGKEKFLNRLRGFELINFLIRNAGKVLDDLGKESIAN